MIEKKKLIFYSWKFIFRRASLKYPNLGKEGGQNGGLISWVRQSMFIIPRE